MTTKLEEKMVRKAIDSGIRKTISEISKKIDGHNKAAIENSLKCLEDFATEHPKRVEIYISFINECMEGVEKWYERHGQEMPELENLYSVIGKYK